jgi:hypothetical protein
MSVLSLVPLRPSRLPVALCCAAVLASTVVLAQAPAAPAAPAVSTPAGQGQLVFGVLGLPLHASASGPVKGSVQGAPALVLEQGPAARDGFLWLRVLTADLSHGWLRLKEPVRRVPVEIRVHAGTSGEPCSPDDAACWQNPNAGEPVSWDGSRSMAIVGASQKPRCTSAVPCPRETPWLKLTDGATQGWVDAESVGLTWAPVGPSPESRPCATHLAYGLQGLVRGPFLLRPEWAGLTALVQLPTSSVLISEPISTVQLASGRLTLVSQECRRQEFVAPDEGLVDLAAFRCISPDTCQHAVLLEGRYRTGHSSGSTLYVVSGKSFHLPQVRAIALDRSAAEGRSSYEASASWWVESAPQAEGGTLWIVQAIKEHVEDGKPKPSRVGVEQVTVGPVDEHPEHPAHPTPRAFQAILLAEGETRDSLMAKLGSLETCLGQPIPRFEVPRGGRWLHAAGRLFETPQQAAAWKAAVHRCGMKQGFTFATLPNLARQ